jgi:hypothetical protein
VGLNSLKSLNLTNGYPNNNKNNKNNNKRVKIDFEVRNQFRKVSASFRYDLEAKTRLLSFFKKKIVLENSIFHLLPQRVRANHLVFIMLQDQSYSMVYGIW